jgi:hypothetical protein
MMAVIGRGLICALVSLQELRPCEAALANAIPKQLAGHMEALTLHKKRSDANPKVALRIAFRCVVSGRRT